MNVDMSDEGLAAGAAGLQPVPPQDRGRGLPCARLPFMAPTELLFSVVII